jgi:hypothetical protein
MTTVFFLFLFHASLGLMAMLALVPERAGPRYFKLNTGAAAFMSTAGLWLLYRRFGQAGGPEAPGGAGYAWLLGLGLAFLAATVLHNRAWHFGWRRARPPLLAAALAAGTAAVVAGAAPGPRALVAGSDLSSALLMGSAAGAMILGHFYLVVLDLPIAALRRLTVALLACLALRAAVVAFVLLGPFRASVADARLVAAGLWSADGVFIWMRLLFGLLGPASLGWFIWKTVEIRSTQSATGILYVQLFLVMAGELLAKHLRVAAGLPL